MTTKSVSNADLMATLERQEREAQAHRQRLLQTLEGLRVDFRYLQLETDKRLTQYYEEFDAHLKDAENTKTQVLMRLQEAELSIKALEGEVSVIRRILTPEQQAALNAQIAEELDSISEVEA